MNGDMLEQAGLIAGLLAMIELVKFLINKMVKKDNTFTSEDRAILTKLADLHSAKDEDGVPLWYMPRSYTANQGKILELMQQQAHILDVMSRTLDRLEKRGQNG